MKVEEHRSLWSAIQQFPLDDPDAAITFSHKLAAKQNWSAFYTERVIAEYRKFLFLCCIAPNGASPSQAVDEAWHLHLTYTRSYWIDLCKNTLGKDIHHHPSRGGDEEDHKHRDWYKETLELYQSVFESPLPDDIWPPPAEINNHIPEPIWTIPNETIALVVMLLTLPLIVSAYLHKVLSPFSLTGSQFLVFFPLLAISCIICFILVQNQRFKHFPDLTGNYFPNEASAFETAQLLFGRKRVIQTAIVDLIRRNLLVLTTDKMFLVYKGRYIKQENEQNPLIGSFLQEERSCVTYEWIMENWQIEEPEGFTSLQQLHELANRKEPFIKKYHFLIIPFFIGIARFIQGMANHKPVSFLFLEMIALLIVTSIVAKTFARKAWMVKKVAEKAKIRQQFGLLCEDKIVGDFAMKGNEAIDGFSDGLVLIGLFGIMPFFDRVTRTVDNFLEDTSYIAPGEGGGGCSGGGSCGSGCGGGCGGCGS